MIKIERKKLKNNHFYFLTERFNTGKGFKKIQVYLGKNVPTNLSPHYEALYRKELALLNEYHPKTKSVQNTLEREALERLEKYALQWKYFIIQRTEREKEQIFRDFAIQFIFESNSIEGSKLSQEEVSRIIRKKYVKKSLPRREVQEVYNALEAMGMIRSGEFALNQKNIKILHQILTRDLGYTQGFRKVAVNVNNKNVLSPDLIKKEIQSLIEWYRKGKRKGNPFRNAIIFHNRFEYIHPFEDGNGRTGRMLLLWMLFEHHYDVILFRKRNTRRYFRALDHGDEGRYTKLILYAVEAYKKTVREIRERYEDGI